MLNGSRSIFRVFKYSIPYRTNALQTIFGEWHHRKSIASILGATYNHNWGFQTAEGASGG